jgi:uncharacterized protein
MRLYSGSSSDFIDDSVHNRIADKLRSAYFVTYRREASPSEINSWRNSLRAVSQVFETAALRDHGVLLEYELPLTSKRLDCLITGRNDLLHDNAVIIELKQWDRCEEGDGDRVVTFVGRADRDILHPSIQVGQYKMYLEDGHTAFHEGEDPVALRACSYLHNYSFANNDPILASKFESALAEFPLFSSDDVDKLTEYLRPALARGQGMHSLNRILESRYRPSKKLLDHVGKLLDGRAEYVLLDEQLVAFDRVLAEAKRGYKDKRKATIIVRGGPGTGKSVIALNLLSTLSRLGLNAHYVTGSKAFTNTIRRIVGNRASQQIKYFNSYTAAAFNDVDVMICDEAHRIREVSHTRYTPRPRRSDKLQIEELFYAAKVGVFFVDDNQVVRPGEVGSAQMVLEEAKRENCRVFEYQLEAQFRCSGSDGFINWINNTLEIERTANVLWNVNDKFDFRIVDSAEEADRLIKERIAAGATGRMTAGFCWPWSDPQPNGLLVADVAVGEYGRPWNAKSDAGRLAREIPPENLWAYDPRGSEQIGCIYTAQGFEFDYVGVIFGPDLVYRHGVGWVGDKTKSFDSIVKRSGDRFVDLVKNTYRVLLTRGMKGCFVYFMDKETEQLFRSRTEKLGDAPKRDVEMSATTQQTPKIQQTEML